MFKPLSKAALLLTILCLVKLPFVFWRTDELSHRRAAIAERSYNAVFLGSSRTKMGVVPALFDALNDGATSSYNFGIEAGVPPYTFDWGEELIETREGLKYVFIELSGGENISARFHAPWREFYLREYLAEMKKSSFADAQTYHNRLVVDFLKPSLPAEAPDHTAYNLPLEEALVRPQFVPPRVTKIDELRLSETRNRRVETSTDEFPLDEEYWERIERLIELAAAKGVRLYFFVPPRLELDAEAEKIQPVLRRLDEKYKIRVNHFEPALYRPAVSVDEFHLNHAGALRFTRNFAEAFKKQGF